MGPEEEQLSELNEVEDHPMRKLCFFEEQWQQLEEAEAAEKVVGSEVKNSSNIEALAKELGKFDCGLLMETKLVEDTMHAKSGFSPSPLQESKFDAVGTKACKENIALMLGKSRRSSVRSLQSLRRRSSPHQVLLCPRRRS